MRIEKCVREGNIYVVYIIMYIPTAFTGQEQNGTVWFVACSSPDDGSAL